MSVPKNYRPKNFRLQDFERRQIEISLCVSHFSLPYLREVYAKFEGDLAACIVLGEIAHHSLSRLYSGAKADVGALKALSTPERTKIAGKFQRCNAFSIAACTGIPRETVRRKVEVLVAKGLVNRTSDGLAVGPGIAQRLDPNFPKWQVDQILEMAAKLQRLLSNAPAGQRK